MKRIFAVALSSIFVPALAFAQLQNPIGPSTIYELLNVILTVFLRVAIPVLAIFIVLVGFQFVTARGNPGALEKARNNLLWTIIGSAIVLGAVVISNLLRGTINQILPE